MTTFKYPNPNIYYMATNANKLIINFPAAKMVLNSPNFVISAEADSTNLQLHTKAYEVNRDN